MVWSHYCHDLEPSCSDSPPPCLSSKLGSPLIPTLSPSWDLCPVLCYSISCPGIPCTDQPNDFQTKLFRKGQEENEGKDERKLKFLFKNSNYLQKKIVSHFPKSASTFLPQTSRKHDHKENGKNVHEKMDQNVWTQAHIFTLGINSWE